MSARPGLCGGCRATGVPTAIANHCGARQLAPDFRPRGNGTLRGFLVQLELELQRIEQRVIESEVVHTFTALRRKAKMPIAVRCGGA